MSELFKIEIKSSLKPYTVRIGRDIVAPAVGAVSAVQIMDRRVASLFKTLRRPECIEIEALESDKTLITVANIITQLRDGGATRQSHVVALGGGIIQDVATFAASSYMRGIPWTYCPTTLLGMVDSCIGGKSSINVGPYKNIAGNFYPPEEILIDTIFYDTLHPDQKIDGLCEAVKICFAGGDGPFAEYVTRVESDGIPTSEGLPEMIHLVLSTKKKFIEEDEFDQGIRLLLNFGHTFGHAIEGGCQYAISHGVAVGLGMLAAITMSQQDFGLDPMNARVQQLGGYVRQLLRQVDGLASHLEALDVPATLACFKSDKKHTQDQFAMILINPDGYLTRQFVPKTNEIEQKIGRILRELGTQLYEV